MFGFREIQQIARNVFRALIPEVRTHLVGQVVSYDPTTNTAEIQPVTRAIRVTDADNLTTAALPVLADVPVMQRGSGKLWSPVAPAVGSYGTLHISDREIETWLTKGGIVDPGVTRICDLSDAIFEPGAVPLVADGDNGLIEEPIATDRIGFRTRSNKTEISVLDDETIAINVNDGKATITIDTTGTVTVTADDDVTIDAPTVIAGGGADFVALAQTTDDKIQAIVDAITNAAPGSMDGGAAYKAAMVALLSASIPALGSVASGNLKAD